MYWERLGIRDHHQQTRHHLARVGQEWPYHQQSQKGPYLARTGQWLPRAPDYYLGVLDP